MLTTRCPHCTTMFRIRPEQLSVRGGRVRCGHCHQAFSALASLEELPEEELPGGGGTADTGASVPQPVPTVPATVPASEAPVELAPKAASAVSSDSKSPAIPDGASTSAASDSTLGSVPDSTPIPISIGPLIKDVSLDLPEPPAAEPEFISDDTTAGLQITWMSMDENLVDDGVLQPAPAETISSERFTLPGEIEAAPVPQRAAPVEVPAEEVGADNGFATEGADIDFDLSKFDEPDVPVVPAQQPYKSKIAEALGIEPYDSTKEESTGFTVLLEDSVDLPGQGAISLDDIPHGAVEIAPKPRRMPWVLGVCLLLLLAGLQAAFFFRTDLARVLPQTRPWLEAVCRVAGCSVPYPRDSELIIVESSSLNPEGGEGRFRLTVSLHNKAAFAEAWPYLELTLTDRFDIAIARRVLTPAEWLPADAAARPAFASRDDVTANLIVNVDKLPAAGYRLYAFYP